jgi:hypothetical protein
MFSISFSYARNLLCDFIIILSSLLIMIEQMKIIITYGTQSFLIFESDNSHIHFYKLKISFKRYWIQNNSTLIVFAEFSAKHDPICHLIQWKWNIDKKEKNHVVTLTSPFTSHFEIRRLSYSTKDHENVVIFSKWKHDKQRRKSSVCISIK